MMGNMKEVSGHGGESESLIVKGEIENRGVVVDSSAIFWVFSNQPGQFDFKSASFLLLHFLVFTFFFFKIIHN